MVDFCNVTDTASDNIYRSVHYHRIRDGIGANKWIGRPEPRKWDGRDRTKAVSRGLHKIQVRAWDDEDQWVTAWSDAFLTVSK